MGKAIMPLSLYIQSVTALIIDCFVFFTSFSCEGLLHKLNSIYHSKLNIFVHSTKKLTWKFLCLNYVKQRKRGKSFRPQDKQPRKKCTLNHIK